jgi:hypothetical protein
MQSLLFFRAWIIAAKADDDSGSFIWKSKLRSGCYETSDT